LRNEHPANWPEAPKGKEERRQGQRTGQLQDNCPEVAKGKQTRDIAAKRAGCLATGKVNVPINFPAIARKWLGDRKSGCADPISDRAGLHADLRLRRAENEKIRSSVIRWTKALGGDVSGLAR
jgi:hypothetical protein